MTADNSYQERRQRQRFAALRDGKPAISLHIGDIKTYLIDMSIDGFSIAAGIVETDTEFDFEMRLVDGFGDKVKGRAKAVNKFGPEDAGQTGCQFTTLEESGEKILQEWLTVIVICGASVRLTPADAEAIVKGPSLI